LYCIKNCRRKIRQAHLCGPEPVMSQRTSLYRVGLTFTVNYTALISKIWEDGNIFFSTFVLRSFRKPLTDVMCLT